MQALGVQRSHSDWLDIVPWWSTDTLLGFIPTENCPKPRFSAMKGLSSRIK